MSHSTLQREIFLRFGPELDSLVHLLDQTEAKEYEEFLNEFADPDSPVWLRYSQAIYNNPKTWWIGLIQISMLSGLWGHRHRRAASIRQNTLSQTFAQYFSRRSDEQQIKDAEQIIRYNLKYRKAEVLGRLHGGLFTSYAASGGALGKRLPAGTKIPAAAVNFTVASFGACIQAVAKGHRSYGALAQSILIGKPESVSEIELFNHKLPSEHGLDSRASGEALLFQITSVREINAMNSSPIPISEFCSRPENRHLRTLCERS